VFSIAGDPVGTGIVDSLSRPGGNATGFAQFEFSLSGKWLELLKQVAPGVTRAAILRDASLGTGTSQFAAIQAVASSLRMEVVPINLRDAADIEQSIEIFARTPNGGLILTASGSAQRHRDMVISLAARHKMPAIYYARFFVVARVVLVRIAIVGGQLEPLDAEIESGEIGGRRLRWGLLSGRKRSAVHRGDELREHVRQRRARGLSRRGGRSRAAHRDG